jgi:hypothetical protein
MSITHRTALVTRGHLSSSCSADLAAALTAAGATVIPASTARQDVLEPAMDVRAHTAAGERTLAQLADPIRELARTATPSQRPHVRAIVDTVRALAEQTRQAARSARQVAGLVDPITSVHEFARTVRPLLAAGDTAELQAVFARTNRRTRNAPSLRALLGDSKHDELIVQLDRWEGRDDEDRPAPAGLSILDLGIQVTA